MPFSSVLGASSVIKPGVCTSTTRPSVPFEGQLIYETDTDRVAAYNGSAWVYTNSDGLVLVKTQTINSGVISMAVTGAFSSDYENYRIIVSGGVANYPNNLWLQLGNTTTGYYGFRTYGSFNAATVTGQQINNSSNLFVGFGSVNSLFAVIDVSGPNAARRTAVSAYGVTTQSNAGIGVMFGGGFEDSNTQHTGFSILTDSVWNMTGGIIRVYGYKN